VKRAGGPVCWAGSGGVLGGGGGPPAEPYRVLRHGPVERVCSFLWAPGGEKAARRFEPRRGAIGEPGATPPVTGGGVIRGALKGRNNPREHLGYSAPSGLAPVCRPSVQGRCP